MKRRGGFSILELIIVIVVVAIGAVAIGSAFTYISRSQRLTVDILTATQLAQECAAHVVGLGTPSRVLCIGAGRLPFDHLQYPSRARPGLHARAQGHQHGGRRRRSAAPAGSASGSRSR